MNSFLFLLLFFSFFFCPDQPKQNWYWWPRLNIQDNNIWRWGKNDKTDNFYCNFMFCFQQWWGSHRHQKVRDTTIFDLPNFLEIANCIGIHAFTSFTERMVYIHWNNPIMTCCLPIYVKFRGMNATHECMHLIKLWSQRYMLKFANKWSVNPLERRKNHAPTVLRKIKIIKKSDW